MATPLAAVMPPAAVVVRKRRREMRKVTRASRKVRELDPRSRGGTMQRMPDRIRKVM
jgi:hypothetical protein